MTTLVVCLDRTDDVGRRTGLRTPIVGWEAVRALVTDVGLADPEDSGVNTLLESLRVAQSLRDDDEETVVAVVSGDRESMVSADRAVARQLDDLMTEYEPDSAVVVIDSAEDERLVPIVESRLQVDAVDRVVVRQARDIESTYYLLKQFLADEELRQTILVPLGLTLLVFPILASVFTPAVGAATITAVIGLFLLYKGFSIDERLTRTAKRLRESLYSGQVSVVTYVVAIGLTLVGLFVGALGVSTLEDTQGVLVPTMRFVFDSVPWLAAAGLTASLGRLFDELIDDGPLRSSYLHLPSLVVSVGLVVRGFSGFFLEQQGWTDPLIVQFGQQGFGRVAFTAEQRLALFVGLAILLSLVGVFVVSRIADSAAENEYADGDESAAEEEPSRLADAELTDGGSKSARSRDEGTAGDSDDSADPMPKTEDETGSNVYVDTGIDEDTDTDTDSDTDTGVDEDTDTDTGDDTDTDSQRDPE
ncbi:DUF373 family protein [Natronosalvus caseinilyticus]|uniref:DUF373 family protein n=1 Tax=Natronosalvus caseinilyticus TaxID=2953747 RepID=UPI0028A86DE4|nr:DUF373 family protein [Natronosalvus caseinilyticus]